MSISNDLRTPLAGARLLVETEPDDLAGRRENRAVVLGALTRLESTVEDVLTLSQLGRIYGARPTDLVDLDEIVLREVAALAGTTECIHRCAARVRWSGRWHTVGTRAG